MGWENLRLQILQTSLDIGLTGFLNKAGEKWWNFKLFKLCGMKL